MFFYIFPVFYFLQFQRKFGDAVLRFLVSYRVESFYCVCPDQTSNEAKTMVLLELDPFLNELTKLYEQSKNLGTIWVTLKRSTLQRQKKRKTIEETPAQVPEPSEFRCLVRATDGKKKISCSLTAKNHLRFQTSYATVLKAHMDSLKKKEKNDKKEKRTTAAKAAAS